MPDSRMLEQVADAGAKPDRFTAQFSFAEDLHGQREDGRGREGTRLSLHFPIECGLKNRPLSVRTTSPVILQQQGREEDPQTFVHGCSIRTP